MKNWLAIFAGMTVAAGAAAQDPSCSRCDREIELDQKSWDCLLRRVRDFKKNDTPIFFFTLSPKVCAGSLGPGKGVKVPSENQPGTGPRVYRLSRWQIDCLDRRGGSVPGPLYRVNFAKICNR